MYSVEVNGTHLAPDDSFYDDDEGPGVHVSFPGEEGVSEWTCEHCGESTQEEPGDGSNADPESLCENTECGTCEGSGAGFTEGSDCTQCGGTGNGPHAWQLGEWLWLNSAHINAESDRVSVSISVGDPRGAFVMSVERMNDGTLRLSVPSPDDSLPHMKLTPLASPGYYAIS